ncbi:uncharacterized protein LOC112510372 [Cynara cardunculus var. scolymus]|uniref:uncharacterized protein LOC112510372 n=1 Tax=Cynara cardunculus var. scolymus TaxID=59895 RepID=UPI000D626C41|nr:uncharacterized protein LOC112510372 [Cynara cardunculus var. scolymus]
MPTSQFPANALGGWVSKVDTRNDERNPTSSANKRKREPVGDGNINDNEEKKVHGIDENVEPRAGGMKEVEMKDAEINGGIKEVEMQDASEVEEKTIGKEVDEGKANHDDYMRSNLNAADGCKHNQTTDKSGCHEKQIEGVICDNEGK